MKDTLKINQNTDTVDDLVEAVINYKIPLITYENVCGYIVQCSSSQLLRILTSETNKPSVHDLNIILLVTKCLTYIGNNINEDNHKLILAAYRDRKV